MPESRILSVLFSLYWNASPVVFSREISMVVANGVIFILPQLGFAACDMVIAFEVIN